MNGLISRRTAADVHKVPFKSKDSFSTTKCGGKQPFSILQGLICHTVCALTHWSLQNPFSHISPTNQWKTLQSDNTCFEISVHPHRPELYYFFFNFQASVAARPSAPSWWIVTLTLKSKEGKTKCSERSPVSPHGDFTDKMEREGDLSQRK